ncbi:MAG: substrate-binding domain-containing protein [Candidatus Nanopelagicales bacterium]
MPLSTQDTISVGAVVGYRRWCESAGQNPVIQTPGDADVAAASVAAAVAEGVDAIYAVSAQQQAVLDGIARAGRRCPDDVQVLGIGTGLMEVLFRPALSAIDLEGTASGAAIADLCVSRLAGADTRVAELPWHLADRGTTRPAG